MVAIGSSTIPRPPATITGLRPIRSVANPAGVNAAAWDTAAMAKAIPDQPVSKA